MTLVFILGLEMGLITVNQINEYDRKLVIEALEQLDKMDLIEQ